MVNSCVDVLPQSWWFPFRHYYQREDKIYVSHRANVKPLPHSNNDLLSIGHLLSMESTMILNTKLWFFTSLHVFTCL